MNYLFKLLTLLFCKKAGIAFKLSIVFLLSTIISIAQTNEMFGTTALIGNTGTYNAAGGFKALSNNGNGFFNSVIGAHALLNNTTGFSNAALGFQSLYINTEGYCNVACGQQALYWNDKGKCNTALGKDAGWSNIGDSNVFLGHQAGFYEAGNNKLYIANGKNATLIYGDFISGNIGIGTTTPLSTLSIASNKIGPKITLWDNANAATHFGFGVSAGQLNYHVNDALSSHVFFAGGRNGNGTELMRIRGDGKISIGNGSITTPNQYKLYVQTGILTEKITVAASKSMNWADYVFADNYKLKPLSVVEDYIKTNKHLPNIPSADEVAQNGIDLADMNTKLLEKIEELHLYIFTMQKDYDQLRTELNELKKK